MQTAGRKRQHRDNNDEDEDEDDEEEFIARPVVVSTSAGRSDNSKKGRFNF